MGIENPIHLLFIAAVVLVVLGPKRLPGLARALGQGIREFRASLGEGAEARPQANTQAPADEAPPPPAAAQAGQDRLHTPDQGAASDER
jgi:TatA/E family protein of Tat protein translocase